LFWATVHCVFQLGSGECSLIGDSWNLFISKTVIRQISGNADNCNVGDNAETVTLLNVRNSNVYINDGKLKNLFIINSEIDLINGGVGQMILINSVVKEFVGAADNMDFLKSSSIVIRNSKIGTQTATAGNIINNKASRIELQRGVENLDDYCREFVTITSFHLKSALTRICNL